jgi:hypothetical protein
LKPAIDVVLLKVAREQLQRRDAAKVEREATDDVKPSRIAIEAVGVRLSLPKTPSELA